MFGWFRKKSLESQIHARKLVKVCGVEFVIKRIDVLDYIQGSKVLQQSFDTYKMKGASVPEEEVNNKKIRDHYTDVICSGVVSPYVSRKPEKGHILITDLMTNWELTSDLYAAIVEFSYGKKKLRHAKSLAKSSSKLMS